MITRIDLHNCIGMTQRDDVGDGDGAVDEYGDEDAPHVALVLVTMVEMNSPHRRWQI